MAGLLLFLAGSGHLIRQARRDYEWVATLMFGTFIAVIAIWFVGDGLEGGAALDASVAADPTAVLALIEARMPMYGAIGLVLSALLLALAGYATMARRFYPVGRRGLPTLHHWLSGSLSPASRCSRRTNPRRRATLILGYFGHRALSAIRQAVAEVQDRHFAPSCCTTSKPASRARSATAARDTTDLDAAVISWSRVMDLRSRASSSMAARRCETVMAVLPPDSF